LENQLRAIRLDDDSWFPSDVRWQLRKQAEQIRRAPSFEDLAGLDWVPELIASLDSTARKSQVVCYYCTREIQDGYLLAHGIPVQTATERRRDFLKEAGTQLTEVEVSELKVCWGVYERKNDRPSKVTPLICLDRSALLQDAFGTPGQYCGGSPVYEPVLNQPISWKLMDLGATRVVLAALRGSEIETAEPLGLGEAALSHAHRDAIQWPHRAFRGNALNGIQPRQIRCVIDWSPYRYDPGLTSTTLKLLDDSVNTS
jgi:hypothetical protein